MTRAVSHLSFVLALAASSVLGFSTISQPHAVVPNNRQQQQQQQQSSSSIASRLYLSSPKTDKDEATATTSSSAILDDANDALASVGWAPPRKEGDMTSDDPFVREISAGIQRDFGVPLDELLNPAKVVNLERDLYNLRTDLADLTGGSEDATTTVLGMTTEECDGGGGGEEADAIRTKIDKKEKDLVIERRSVFQGWLKNVFLAQAVISFALSWVMATNPEALFGQFGWFHSYNMDISIKVLGYWWWWLFVVPSLRSRRPKGPEKKALDIAFLATPIISLLAPVATKDTALIWAANFAVVAASYAFAFTVGDDEDEDEDDSQQPEWVKFLYKSLDFGSGRERGARN